jgi:hypothetical protein
MAARVAVCGPPTRPGGVPAWTDWGGSHTAPHPHGQDHHHSVYLSVVVPAAVVVLMPAAVVVLTPAAVVVVTAAAPVIVPDPTPSAASHSFLRLCASL